MTLQLCIKVVKFLNEAANEENVFKSFKRFYSLRSDVVHGKKEIECSKDNKEIVDFVETRILIIVQKFLVLNLGYSYKEINEALKASMYSSLSFSDLLTSIDKRD